MIRHGVLAFLCMTVMACTQNKNPEQSQNSGESSVSDEVNQGTPPAGTCTVAGCSKELCLPEEQAKDLMSTCQWEEEYRCTQMMVCEVQPDGKCGFTPNQKSEACLKEIPKGPAVL